MEKFILSNFEHNHSAMRFSLFAFSLSLSLCVCVMHSRNEQTTRVARRDEKARCVRRRGSPRREDVVIQFADAAAVHPRDCDGEEGVLLQGEDRGTACVRLLRPDGLIVGICVGECRVGVGAVPHGKVVVNGVWRGIIVGPSDRRVKEAH